MKQIDNVEEIGINHCFTGNDRITITTDDGIEYVFWSLRWYDYPVYSHRREDKGGLRHTDSRNYPLPEKVKEYIFDNHGGYYMADGKVNTRWEHKRGYSVFKVDVGDMWPLREP